MSRTPVKLLVGIAVVVLACTLYVAVTAGRELMAARDVLSDISLTDADREDVVEAEAHLERALHHLHSLPAAVLRLVPVARQNAAAIRAVTAAAVPVVRTGLLLDDEVDELEDVGLLVDGRVDVDMLERLSPVVRAQVVALERLASTARERRSGWLLPPLWDALDELAFRIDPVVERASAAAAVLDAADALLGDDDRRRYAVLLMNNAELRGAGGVLTGIGTISFTDGRISIGRFRSVHDLRTDPPQRVEAPADYERRFATFKANTTLWLNSTWSPDVPDVARVAANLLRRTTGRVVDGAILIDPHAIEALADPDRAVRFPGIEEPVPPSDLAEFVFSDVYERFRDQPTRRAAILAAGTHVLEDLVAGADLGRVRLAQIGGAVAGGHLRVVSFDPDEAAALAASGASGELRSPPGTLTLTVTEQNLGTGNGQGSKLDYWVRRRFGYACTATTAAEPACAFHAELSNRTPAGLDRYVAGRPYGLVRNYMEVYLPQAAEVSRVTVNGRDVEFRRELEEGHAAIGVMLKVPRGEVVELVVGHELPVSGSWRVELRPQPLPRPATLQVAIEADARDRVIVGDERARGSIRITRPWAAAIRVAAERDRRTGVSALWSRLTSFWRDRSSSLAW